MADVDFAEVVLWGRVIGAVAWDAERALASFEFMPEFQNSGIELAPLKMPLSARIYAFPELRRETFHGLPGLLADSLPDKFGNLLIDQWLAATGRSREGFTPIHRLCYVGTRGMGALEFRPAIRDAPNTNAPLEIKELVQLANEALSGKQAFRTNLGESENDATEAMQSILSVGTSAGGARAKAVIAWNEATGEIRSGQLHAPDGFQYWLLKFDGVAKNRDKELADPQGYGRVEYAYYRMAVQAGIEMTECRLLEEDGRSHFMTRRFDRDTEGSKLFMQSLCAIAHFDFHRAGAYSYEQAIQTGIRLDIPVEELHQLYRRMVFNVIARNQDDHTKNIAFMMNKAGKWSLSPAFDVTHSYNPEGAWTNRHQMTVNQKRDDFEKSDLVAVAERFRVIGRRRGQAIIAEVADAVSRWPEFAKLADIDQTWTDKIQSHHRLGLA